jgi:hypothetical protein
VIYCGGSVPPSRRRHAGRRKYLPFLCVPRVWLERPGLEHPSSTRDLPRVLSLVRLPRREDPPDYRPRPRPWRDRGRRRPHGNLAAPVASAQQTAAGHQGADPPGVAIPHRGLSRMRLPAGADSVRLTTFSKAGQPTCGLATIPTRSAPPGRHRASSRPPSRNCTTRRRHVSQHVLAGRAGRDLLAELGEQGEVLHVREDGVVRD